MRRAVCRYIQRDIRSIPGQKPNSLRPPLSRRRSTQQRSLQFVESMLAYLKWIARKRMIVDLRLAAENETVRTDQETTKVFLHMRFQANGRYLHRCLPAQDQCVAIGDEHFLHRRMKTWALVTVLIDKCINIITRCLIRFPCQFSIHTLRSQEMPYTIESIVKT